MVPSTPTRPRFKQAPSRRGTTSPRRCTGVLFDYLVWRSTNRCTATTRRRAAAPVLDISIRLMRSTAQQGRFEQALHQLREREAPLFFDACVFGEELRTYEEEGVPFAHVQFEDNARCVAIFDGRPRQPLLAARRRVPEGGEGARVACVGIAGALPQRGGRTSTSRRGARTARRRAALRRRGGLRDSGLRGEESRLSTTLKTLGATGNRVVASFFADDARTKTLGSAFREAARIRA